MRYSFAPALTAFSLAACAVVACGEADDPGPDPGTGTASDALIGEWTGYVENFEFDDTTDSVVISLDSVGETEVTGHVTFGTRAPYAPPTDPEVGYPGGYIEDDPFPYTGFTFTIVEGSFDGERLKFTIEGNEIWTEWCAMQPSLQDETVDEKYSCIHSWGWAGEGDSCTQPHPDTGEEIPIDCGKLFLCGHAQACACTEEGCAAAPGQLLSFDIESDVDEADGSIVGLGDSTPHNVRLTRQ